MQKAMINEISDEELVEIAQIGDRAAEEHLIKKYEKIVEMMSNDYFLVGAEREDLVQEGMIGLLNAINTFDSSRNIKFKTYANRVVQNAITNAIIKYNRKKYAPMADYISIHLPLYDETSDTTLLETLRSTQINDPMELYIKKENQDELKRIFMDLFSKKEYEVAELYAQGMSYKDIAAKLSISQKSVDSSLQRIKKKIKMTFKKY